MPRSLFSTRPRRNRLIDRYLTEPVNFGGEVMTREHVIRTLKSVGADDRSVDRYLQGAELAQQIARPHWNVPTTRIQ